MQSKVQMPADVIFVKGIEVLMTDPNTDFETLCGHAHNEGYHPVRLDNWLNRNGGGPPHSCAPPSPIAFDSEEIFVDNGGDVFMTFPWLPFELVNRIATKRGYRRLPILKWLSRNERRPSSRSPIRQSSSPRSVPSPSPLPSPSPRPSPPRAGTSTEEIAGSPRGTPRAAGGVCKPSRKVLFTHLPRRYFRTDIFVSMSGRHGVEPLYVSTIGTRRDLLRAEVKCQSPQDAERVIEKLGSEPSEEKIRVFEIEEGDNVL